MTNLFLFSSENGPTAIDIFNTGSDAFVIGSQCPAFGLLTNACSANQSASAASVCHRTAIGRIAHRTRRSDRAERFLPPLMVQRAGSNVCGGPAAFVFHFDVEALITDILSFAVISKVLNHLLPLAHISVALYTPGFLFRIRRTQRLASQ